jgi:hypothetical protein
MTKRRLLLMPMAYRPDAIHLYAWIEEERAVLQWITPAYGRGSRRPRGKGRFHLRWMELASSQRELPILNPLGSLIISAVMKQELVGESANSALSRLFDDYLETDAGLAYLYKWAGADHFADYARSRLSCEKDEDVEANAVATATSELAPLVGILVCQQLRAEPANGELRAAIKAISMMGGDADYRQEMLHKFVCEQTNVKEWYRKASRKHSSKSV